MEPRRQESTITGPFAALRRQQALADPGLDITVDIWLFRFYDDKIMILMY